MAILILCSCKNSKKKMDN